MESTTYWIYDIEDGYQRLADFPEDRADKALYLLMDGKNVTKTVTGQTRLTPFTYKCIWHQIIIKKNENFSDIRRVIRERKNQLTKIHQKPPTKQDVMKTRRSDDRLKLWKERRGIAFSPSEPLTPSNLRPSYPVAPCLELVPLLEPVVEVPQQEPVVEIAVPSSPSPPQTVAPVDPAPIYSRITEATLIQRIEEPKNFQIAQYKVIKNIVHEGETICFPMSELSMDMHLAREGLPTDPELLDKLIIDACARRNIEYDTQKVFSDFRRTLGYVRHYPHLSPPHCYQYIKC